MPRMKKNILVTANQTSESSDVVSITEHSPVHFDGLAVQPIVFIDSPELARRVRKSYPTVLNWIRLHRIQPDAYVNSFDKLHNPARAIFSIKTANEIIKAVRDSGGKAPAIIQKTAEIEESKN